MVAETVLLVVTAVVLAVLLRTFVAQAFRIPSESMVPQLEVQDRVVVSRLAYRLHDPHRGDVVVFDCPPRAGCPPAPERNAVQRGIDTILESLLIRQPAVEEYIKRIVALPGETVEGKTAPTRRALPAARHGHVGLRAGEGGTRSPLGDG